MYSFLKHTPEGRNMEFQATQEEKRRVLELVRQMKVKHTLKADTAKIKHKKTGARSFELDRIRHEVAAQEYMTLERAIQHDHWRIF